MDLEIKFVCSNCGQHLAASREVMGETISCPTCGTETILTAAPTPGLPTQKSLKLKPIGTVFAILGLLAALILLGQSAAKKLPAAGKVTAEATTVSPQMQPTTVDSNKSQPKAIATAPQPITIHGLFGVKLGEPLPLNCKIESASETVGGFYAIIFTPPEPNPAFNTYVVYLDASRRVVAMINGQGEVL